MSRSQSILYKYRKYLIISQHKMVIIFHTWIGLDWEFFVLILKIFIIFSWEHYIFILFEIVVVPALTILYLIHKNLIFMKILTRLCIICLIVSCVEG